MGTPFKIINICVLAFFAIALLALPVFISVYYTINFDKLKEPEFEEKYGEVYAGLNAEKKSTIFFAVFFLMRRYIFVITICFTLFWQVWLQISLQMILSLASACFLINFSPFEESLPLQLEIFNEITTVLLLYLVACFTEFVHDVHTHVLIGYAFLFFMIGNMGVHLFFLLRSSIKDCMRNYRKKKNLHASLRDQKLKGLSKDLAENESGQEIDQSGNQKSIKRR